ncbi:hypothetical protein [Dactylosporangium sp. NPDC006015]|uniref:hypothetical protein n=1 Tax=Dactylosporangium sp. NPDC006015 TaxID=3154576 RepID=UPI0033BF2D9B
MSHEPPARPIKGTGVRRRSSHAKAAQDPVSWRPVREDSVLSQAPVPGLPGRVFTGGDLDLRIGWDRFEQLLVYVAQQIVGLNQMRFRRYGLGGQAQRGIDLAGRRADRSYTVVQCKQVEKFTAAQLRTAVRTFADGSRPFGARHLIIAVSVVTRDTQVEDELARAQDAHPDLDIELWGAEQINDELRKRADIVARFWTRETADTFCTGAPLAGVAAAPLDWTRLADQVLRTPLAVDGLDEQLAEADRLFDDQPASAAEIYARLADTLTGENYLGHANVMRRKQLDALAAAGEDDARAALAALLAATALHEGNLHLARVFERQVPAPADPAASEPTTANPAAGLEGPISAAAWSGQLISAAVFAVMHPLADSNELTNALRHPPAGVEPPTYQPLLVLLAAELTVADAIINGPGERPTPAGDGADPVDPVAGSMVGLDDLVTAALRNLTKAPRSAQTKDVTVRLRMIQAAYDGEARTALLAQARQRRIPRHHAAMVLAAQGRRDVLDGSAEEAIEHWRQAVEQAIHDGRTDDAAGWLYAIRAVSTLYGPWTNRLDDEHMLAQALPKTGSSRLIRRTRDPATDARRAALADRPIEALRAARRWLADCIVTGDWAEENAAAELLGDLYAANQEPDRAARCYQWAGERKKATELASNVGDRILARAPIGSGPWWQQSASLAIAAAQHDVIDDATAAALLRDLIDLVTRGRAGELVDNPGRMFTEQAMKTLLIFANRGTSTDAQGVLDLFAADVHRAADFYLPHDKEHARACLAIFDHHADLAWPALIRLFDLADAGAREALKALYHPAVQDLLAEDPAGHHAMGTLAALKDQERHALRKRLHTMAKAGRYEAGLAAATLGDTDQSVIHRALAARDRLLGRPEPGGHSHAFGATMVPDSYLVTFLDTAEQQRCLDKVLTVAEDQRETATNRQDALTAATNLVTTQPNHVKTGVHTRARQFVLGQQEGSALDDEMTNPHPLSSFKVDLGSPSLRGHGLRLALDSSACDDDRIWVRDQARVLLSAEDQQIVHDSAQVLSRLGADMIRGLDVTLLVGHPDRVVREFAAFVAATEPVRYALTLPLLAQDRDWTVRAQLALAIHTYLQSTNSAPTSDVEEADLQRARAIAEDVRTALSRDVRHRVRRAAAGHPR